MVSNVTKFNSRTLYQDDEFVGKASVCKDERRRGEEKRGEEKEVIANVLNRAALTSSLGSKELQGPTCLLPTVCGSFLVGWVFTGSSLSPSLSLL